MSDRVTQIATEALDQPATLNVRVTQFATEALDQPATLNVRVTQFATEVLRAVASSAAFAGEPGGGVW